MRAAVNQHVSPSAARLGLAPGKQSRIMGIAVVAPAARVHAVAGSRLQPCTRVQSASTIRRHRAVRPRQCRHAVGGSRITSPLPEHRTDAGRVPTGTVDHRACARFQKRCRGETPNTTPKPNAACITAPTALTTAGVSPTKTSGCTPTCRASTAAVVIGVSACRPVAPPLSWPAARQRARAADRRRVEIGIAENRAIGTAMIGA